MAEVKFLRKMIRHKLLPWVFYEEMEARDATIYLLFVRAIPTVGKQDVRYVDFGEILMKE